MVIFLYFLFKIVPLQNNSLFHGPKTYHYKVTALYIVSLRDLSFEKTLCCIKLKAQLNLKLQRLTKFFLLFTKLSCCNAQYFLYKHLCLHSNPCRERSGSVVECLTRDQRATGSSLTGVTALWSLSKTHFS